MKKVCLAGVGLIGGSLGLALCRTKSRQYNVTGWGRSLSKLKKARQRGAIHNCSTQIKTAVQHADIVVLSVPVQKTAAVLKLMVPHLKKGAIITDCGSTKEKILKDIRPFLKKRKDVFFVGGHPVAGSEKSGVEHADRKLFHNAKCVLTSDGAQPKTIRAVKKLWKDAGADCLVMTAQQHDRVLALTSHLPHLLSFGFFQLVSAEAKRNKNIKKLVGASFRDMTRIAGSDPHVWTEIFQQNKKQVKKVHHRAIGLMSQYLNKPPTKLFQSLSSLKKAKQKWSK